jgi:putative ABC transport system permease protein
MKFSELIRLVWINLMQNKFKVILTSIGIVVGSATIMLVIAIGTGGKMDVADQFANLNAGAIDISYESSESSADSIRSLDGGRPGPPDMSSGFDFPGMTSSDDSDRMNQEDIVLSEEDMDDLMVFVPGIEDATISYSTKADIEGGDLDEAESYTVAGTLYNYADISNLELSIGDYLSKEDGESKLKVCVLGYTTAIEIFGSAYDAYDEIVYIDDRPYVVTGVLEEMGSVSSGISPDSSIFIYYDTGIKYLTGEDVNPTITVVAGDINEVDQVITNVETVLFDSYPNAEFTISDAGSKMEAASASNDTLTMLLISMAIIVFVVGGIGIMNVLFVSVKERTNEIGVLKAMGCARRDILLEFLFEATCMSFVGSIIGVTLSLAITPIIESFNVRVELSIAGALISLAFGVITGTIFGFYPAQKASRLIPVVALNQE